MSQIKLSENFIKSNVKLALNEDLYPSGDITSSLIENNKIEIKAFAEKHWGETFEEQDFADAACIALWIKRKFESEKIDEQEKQEDKKRRVTKG